MPTQHVSDTLMEKAIELFICRVYFPKSKHLKNKEIWFKEPRRGFVRVFIKRKPPAEAGGPVLIFYFPFASITWFKLMRIYSQISPRITPK